MNDDHRKRPGLWVRIHSRIQADPSVLATIAEGPKGLEACAVYVFGIAWSKDHGTDGVIPKGALGQIHGNRRHAELLVSNDLWEPLPGGGWRIPEETWAKWQETTDEIKKAREARRKAGKEAACKRWHDQPCLVPDCPTKTGADVIQLEVKGNG